MKPETFHGQLKKKMDKFVHLIYRLTRNFPIQRDLLQKMMTKRHLNYRKKLAQCCEVLLEN